MAASTRATNLRKVWQNFRSEIFIENTANTFKQRLLKKGCEIAQTMHEFSARNFPLQQGFFEQRKDFQWESFNKISANTYMKGKQN